MRNKKPTDLTLSSEGKAFVTTFYSNGKNASAAFRVAFPHIKGTNLEIANRALQFKKIPAVKNALEIGRQKELAKIGKVMDKYAITQERIAEELAKLAFANVDDYLEWGPDGVSIKPSSELSDDVKKSIAEISEVRNKDTGTVIKIKPYDKLAALTALGKTLGMFQEKVQHEHKHVAVSFVIDK